MSAAGDEYAAADTTTLDFSDLLNLSESAFTQYDAVDLQGLVAEDVPGFDVTKYVSTIPVSPASSDTTFEAICQRACRTTGPYSNRTMAYSLVLRSPTTLSSRT